MNRPLPSSIFTLFSTTEEDIFCSFSYRLFSFMCTCSICSSSNPLFVFDSGSYLASFLEGLLYSFHCILVLSIVAAKKIEDPLHYGSIEIHEENYSIPYNVLLPAESPLRQQDIIVNLHEMTVEAPTVEGLNRYFNLFLLLLD